MKNTVALKVGDDALFQQLEDEGDDSNVHATDSCRDQCAKAAAETANDSLKWFPSVWKIVVVNVVQYRVSKFTIAFLCNDK
ncbi:hypothetical protein F0562_007104 [Nyssa sinensis]|uniref:Uncharacterized protein n=1 Tax=Nyssa sinensis TaxID=561372 RepID=A0A5J5A4F4_9ASTE|nr:hypothetical protein F0562_007104 [Nyssa sinensis]